MKKKLYLAISLTLIMLLMSSSFVLAADIDFEKHWARDSIMRLYDRGIVTGESNSNDLIIINPNREITRAEFVTMLIRLLTVTESVPQTSAIYSDTKGHWAESYINLANKAGLVSGYLDGTFKPNNPINRAEITTIMIKALALDVQNIDGTNFNDVDVSYWARPYIIKAKQNSIVSGYPDNSFKPLGYASRAEAITIIDRVNNSFISELTVKKGVIQSIIRKTNENNATSIIKEQDAIDSFKLSDLGQGKYELDKSLLEFGGPFGLIIKLDDLKHKVPGATMNSQIIIKITNQSFSLNKSDLGDPLFIAVIPNDISEEDVLNGLILIK